MDNFGIPYLKCVADLYGKPEREVYRAYHERNEIHKADHLFNFCVSTQALKDYLLEELGILDSESRRKFHEDWSNNTLISSVGGIANLSKHFVLRDQKSRKPKTIKTLGANPTKSEFVDIYSHGDGELFAELIVASDWLIVVESGEEFSLIEFTRAVLEYWRNIIQENGIALVPLGFADLSGGSDA